MLSKLQQQKFIRLFVAYDLDNSGYLGWEDFEQFVKNVATQGGLDGQATPYNSLLQKYAYRWMHLKGEADVDRSSKIDLHEWLTYCEGVLQNDRKYHQEIDPIVNLIFDVFDADGDGFINQAEWRQFAWSFRCHSIYARETFQAMDLDGDGKLEKSEIAEAFRMFYFNDEMRSPIARLFGPI